MTVTGGGTFELAPESATVGFSGDGADVTPPRLRAVGVVAAVGAGTTTTGDATVGRGRDTGDVS